MTPTKPPLTALAAALMLMMASCSPSRYFAGTRPPELALVEPVAYMSYVQRDGELVPDDSLSLVSTSMLTRMFTSSGLPVVDIVPVDYWGHDSTLLPLVELLPAIDVRQLKRAVVPEPIRQLLRERGHRYGLLVYADGFVRDGRNYAAGVATGVAVAVFSALLTGGSSAYLAFPNKYGSHVFVMVVDAEDNRVLFYNKSTPSEANPLNAKSLRKQVRQLVEKLVG
ncbi:MAG: hypothetical protein IJU72_10430 [Bacteroidales bacterium]|nr:hypothetical protein [Bacteroidales bacterium]